MIRAMEETDGENKIYEAMLIKRGKEIETVHSIATILNTGLNRKVLAILLELIESGVDSESLADGMLFEYSVISYQFTTYLFYFSHSRAAPLRLTTVGILFVNTVQKC